MLSNKAQILVIDDDPIFLKLIESTLGPQYDVECAENMKEAWEQIFFFGDSYDLIIVDIVLPDGCGLELIRKIREVNHWVPIMVMTGHSTQRRAENACNLGVCAYIQKPFDNKEIREKIKEITGSWKVDRVEATAAPLLSHEKMLSLHPAIQKCLEEIHKWFHAPFTLDKLADACCISKYHLCKLFRKSCGMTIKDYTNRLKIEVVKKLLHDSSYSISQIQDYVGFKNRTYFFYLFKKAAGMSPLLFRKREISRRKNALFARTLDSGKSKEKMPSITGN